MTTAGRFADEQSASLDQRMLKAPTSPAPELVPVAPEKRVSKGNLLLASLPDADRLKLIGDRPPVDLAYSEEMNQPGDRIRHVYFPIDSFISLITPGIGRAQLEIGLVGSEGMLGVPLLLGINESPLRALVQGAGRAWRIDAAHFLRVIESHASIRTALNRYLYVFLAQLMQTATCTRFHLVEAILGTAALALGRHVQRGRSRALPGKSACGAGDGCAAAGTDREHLVLGGAEAHR